MGRSIIVNVKVDMINKSVKSNEIKISIQIIFGYFYNKVYLFVLKHELYLTLRIFSMSIHMSLYTLAYTHYYDNSVCVSQEKHLNEPMIFS